MYLLHRLKTNKRIEFSMDLTECYNHNLKLYDDTDNKGFAKSSVLFSFETNSKKKKQIIVNLISATHTHNLKK